MELQCSHCGNTEGLTVLLEPQLDIIMVDGKIKITRETISYGMKMTTGLVAAIMGIRNGSRY